MRTFLKVTIMTAVAASLLSLAPRASYAGHDDDWEIAGKVIAGVAAAGVVAAIATGHHADVSVGFSYNHRPPPPPRCEPPRRWIPGHYEVRREKVVTPGYWEVVVDPAEYGWVKHGHHRAYVMIKPECRRRVWVPERCEWVEARVWVPGGWDHTRYAYYR